MLLDDTERTSIPQSIDEVIQNNVDHVEAEIRKALTCVPVGDRAYLAHQIHLRTIVIKNEVYGTLPPPSQPTPDAGEKPDALNFIRRLDQKYRMVCSGDLTPLQIAEAQAKDRFFVDPETACGYALVPWELSTPKDRDRELSIACASLSRSEVQAELVARGIDTAPAFERVKAALRAAGGGGEQQ